MFSGITTFGLPPARMTWMAIGTVSHAWQLAIAAATLDESTVLPMTCSMSNMTLISVESSLVLIATAAVSPACAGVTAGVSGASAVAQITKIVVSRRLMA